MSRALVCGFELKVLRIHRLRHINVFSVVAGEYVDSGIVEPVMLPSTSDPIRIFLAGRAVTTVR